MMTNELDYSSYIVSCLSGVSFTSKLVLDEEEVIFELTSARSSCNVAFTKGSDTYKILSDNLVIYEGSTSDEYTFSVVLRNWLDCTTHFIENAKKVADLAEFRAGENTVYRDYTYDYDNRVQVAIFDVLSKPSITMYVKHSIDNFEDYSVSIEDTELNIIKLYKYSLDDCLRPLFVYDISSYVEELYSKYESSKEYKIKRYDTMKFEVTERTSKDTIAFEVSFDGYIEYRVLSFNGVSLEKPLNILVEDEFDMASIFKAYKLVATNLETEESLQELPNYDSNYDDESVAFESKEVDNCEDLVVKLLTYKDVPKFIRFEESQGIYDVSIEMSSEFNLPINRIQNQEEMKLHHGMLMTDAELARKRFSVDISKDLEVCKSLFNKVFE